MAKALSLLFQLSCCTLGYLYATTAATLAQVTSDGTVNTQVNQNGNVAEITGGETRGGNLFHSFQDFSVPTNNEAFFNNAEAIANIFSRVTGGNTSNIDGLIRANGSASLFLVNPAGIIFGENARLDLGGSFFGSTASSILFEDGEFSAVDNIEQPILTINAPIGLGFRDNPGDIVNRSVGQNPNGETNVTGGAVGLQVPNGETLAIVGGNVLLDDGNLTAKGGHFEIGSVLSEGEVGISETDIGFVLDYDSINSFGDITLQDTAVVDVTASGGGSINVNAQNLTLDNSSLNSGIASDSNSSEAQAGNITIDATEAVELNNSGNINNEVNFGIGNAGDITIRAGSLSVVGGSSIDSRTSGLGNAGNVFIEASGITFSDSDIFTEVSSDGGFGDAGDIKITTNSLSLQDGSTFLADTENQGNAGNIFIEAVDSVVLEGRGENTFSSQITSTVDAGNNPNVTGDAGNIEINTGSLSIVDGGFISTSTFGLGNGGKITINAKDLVSLGNEESNGRLTSDVGSNASGNSGGIEINTNSLAVNNFSQITSQVDGKGNSGDININARGKVSFDGRDETDTVPSAIFTSVEPDGEGNGGNININAESLELTNRAQLLSNVEGIGDAGDINIQVENEVNFVNSALISEVSAPDENGEGGRGNGGDINITTRSLFVRDGSAFLADTENIGDAGNINIEARDSVIVEGEGRSVFANATNIVPSQITATVDGQTNPDVIGNAGNLKIDTQKLSVNVGRISASTFGSGTGGDLTITASEIEIGGMGSGFPTSIFAKAIDGTGNAGNLTITTDTLVVKDLSSIDVGNFVRTFPGQTPPPLEPGKGAAGSLTINANSITVNNAIISADNANGVGGELEINTDSLTLENGGSIVAETTANEGRGGNINLSVNDILQMRDNSFISAQAFNNANGGNLTIATDFIIAFPEGDNDIIASAERGRGGNITIDAESLLGIEERPLSPFTNDINASSQVRGLDGTVNITAPDINPVQGATELPTNLVVPEQTVAQACRANRETAARSSFAISGKGGTPPEPSLPLDTLNVYVDGEAEPGAALPEAFETSQGKIQPARGVRVTEDGIMLTAYRTNSKGNRPTKINSGCD